MGGRTLVGIGQLVQFDSIADFLSIGKLTDLIETSRIFLHRLLQKIGLFGCRFQLNANRAGLYHVHILPQYRTTVNSWQRASDT